MAAASASASHEAAADQPRVKLNTGFKLPLVGFGTYHTINKTGFDDAVDAALRVGYRLFDTRKKYRNEELLQAALAASLPRYGLVRREIRISVKCSFDKLDSPEKVSLLVLDSFLRLKTGYLDMFIIDYPAELPPNDEISETLKEQRKMVWQVLEEFKAPGDIRSLGVSRYEIYHLKEIKAFGGSMPAVNQIEFHPHSRRPALRKYCEENGILVQAHSSLGQRSDELFSDKEINRLAAKYHVTPRTIVLSYATSQGIGVIPRSVNPMRIEQNFNCFKLKLSPAEIKELETFDKEKYKPPNADWKVKK